MTPVRTYRYEHQRRAAEVEAAQAAAADRARADENHSHAFGNWEYVMDHTHEVRECRGCGFAEMRPVRF